MVLAVAARLAKLIVAPSSHAAPVELQEQDVVNFERIARCTLDIAAGAEHLVARRKRFQIGRADSHRPIIGVESISDFPK